jgi:hypothetical protein
MTRSRIVASLLSILGAAYASGAIAQQAPAAPAEVVVPRHACAKPGDFPGNLASDTQRRTWQREYLAYQDCMKKYIAEQKAVAEPYVKAYNAAIDEYNETVKTLNEQIEKFRK